MIQFLLLLFAKTLYADNCFVQVSELDPASFVLLHEPSIATKIDAWHPYGALYEPIGANLPDAIQAHKNFRQAISSKGISTRTVREVLLTATMANLTNMAMKYLRYWTSENLATWNANQKYYLSDAYKRRVLESYPKSELIDILITQPSVQLVASKYNTAVATVNITVHPVGNLVFTRDQQITTGKGVIIGHLNSIQRAPENAILKMVWQTLGVPIVGSILDDVPRGRLEGGDYVALNGPDLVTIGVGVRTNYEAIDYLLRKDLFGANRVAVVVDYFDLNQDRMHLDTVFNVVDKKLVVILQDIVGETSPKRRLVDLWVRQSNGVYTKTRSKVEFSRFLIEEGYTLIKVTNEQQLAYMINFVNLGKGRIISVHPDLGRVLRAAGYNGMVQYVNYSGLTALYGAAHCTSQVLRGPMLAAVAKERWPVTEEQLSNSTNGGNAGKFHPMERLHAQQLPMDSTVEGIAGSLAKVSSPAQWIMLGMAFGAVVAYAVLKVSARSQAQVIKVDFGPLP